MAKIRGRYSKRVITDVREVIELKAQGWSDMMIRNKFSWTPSQYKIRLDYLREGQVFENEAKEFCLEAIHRMKKLRDLAWEDYVMLKNQRKANGEIVNPNSMVGAMKLVRELESDMIDAAVNMGLVKKGIPTKPKKPDEVIDSNKELAAMNLGEMTDDELDRAYQAELQKINVG